MVLLRCSSIFLGLLLVAVSALAQQETESLLVARPQIRSTLFAESVVLVTRHGRSRPMGVILNKPANVRFSLPEGAKETKEPRQLYLGGPVSPQVIVYVFRNEMSIEGRPNLLRLGGGLYMGMGDAPLGEMLRLTPDLPLRAFAGLSSWAHSQLESEIARGDWLVLPYEADTVMRTDTASLWQELIARASQRRI